MVTTAIVVSPPPAGASGSLSISQIWSVNLPDTGSPIMQSSPNIAELADGPAVVVGDTAGNVYALNMSNGSTVPGWPFHAEAPIYSTPSVYSPPGTTDDDEILVGVGDANAPLTGGYQAIDAQGQSQWFVSLPSVPGQGGDSAVQASMAVGDLQGTMSAVAGELGQEEAAMNVQNGDMLSGFPWFEADSNFSTPALADLYGNGQTEIVEGGDSTAGSAYGTQYTNGGHLRVLSQDGNAGTNNPSGGLICEYNTDQNVMSSPAVGPILSGGAMGIAFGTGVYYSGTVTGDEVLVVNSNCGLVWAQRLDGTTTSSPALANVAGNGQLDVVEGTDNDDGGGSVWVLNGANGAPVWRANATGEIVGSAVTADLSGNGYQDPIVPTTSGVDIFDGQSGTLADTLDSGNWFLDSPLVTHDANGTIGITVAGYNSSMQSFVTHYEVGGTNATGVYEPGAWPMFHHDPQLTGFSPVWSPPPYAEPNLLANSAFEQSGIAPWQVGPGQNRSVYSSSSAPDGSDYAEVNSGTTAGASFYQDVGMAPQAGDSYDASAYLRSPSAVPVPVSLVLWAIGGSAPTEIGQTQFTVSSTTWAQYDTVLDVADAGHTLIRYQIYVGAQNVNLDVAGAMLQGSGVEDGGFTQGAGNWQAGSGNRAVFTSSDLPAGQDYMQFNGASASDGSLWQDVPVAPQPGNTYTASVFLSSPTGTSVPVNMVLWALGGSAPTEVGQSQFTVSSTSWAPYTADIDVADPGHSLLRLQFYVGSTTDNLDVCDPAVADSLVPDSGCDQPGLGPWVVSPGANASVETGSSAPTGDNWLQTNTNGGSSSSVYQDLAGPIVVGHTYTAGALMESASGGPISVTLVLWALGGGATELGQTEITVGSSWHQYTTALDVADSGHTMFRLQIYVETSGQTLAIDGATLPDAGYA